MNPISALLIVAAGTEVVTALVLIVAPSIFTHLLFGGDLSGPGQGLGRLAGFALLALALACWPVGAHDATRALEAFLLFSFLAAVYLIYIGVTNSAQVGVLLWPAVALHGVLALLLARAWLRERSTS